MAKPLIINGVNVTSYLPPTGYTVNYEPVDGGQGGTMQSGIYTEDEIALKAIVTVPAMPLSDNRLSNLLSNIYSSSYCVVQYFDTMRKTIRQVTARRSTTPQECRGTGADGSDYWTGLSITLRER